MPINAAYIESGGALRYSNYSPSPHLFYRQSSGQRYFIGLDNATRHIEAWKSGDGITWSRQDSIANEPVIAISGFWIFAAAADLDGAWVWYQSSGTNPEATSIVHFDFDSDTWDTPVSGGPSVQDDWSPLFDIPAPMHLAILSDGRIRGVYASKPVSTVRAKATEFDPIGSAWTNDIDLGDGAYGHNFPAGIAIGLNDRTHVLLHETDGAATEVTKLRQATWDTTGTVHPHQMLNDFSVSGQRTYSNWAWGPPAVAVSGSNRIVHFPAVTRYGAGDNRAVSYSAISADEPSWSQDVFSASIDAAVPGVDHRTAAVAAEDKVVGFFIDNSVGKTYFNRWTPAGGWGIPEDLLIGEFNLGNPPGHSPIVVDLATLTFGMANTFDDLPVYSEWSPAILAERRWPFIRRIYSGR